MSETPLVSIEKSGSAWHLTLQGYTEADAVGGYLWPEGVPPGVRIVPLVVVQEPAQTGEFELTGLTVDALQSMEPSVAQRITEESTMTADPPDGAVTSNSPQSAPPADDGPGGSEVDLKMDETAVEYVDRQLERTSEIVDATEIAEQIGIKLLPEAAAHILEPVGFALDLYVMFAEVIKAFGTGRRLQEQEGFCYGAMWETFGLPNGKKAFIDWAGDSADDLREAFFDGVTRGRDKAKDVKEHNAIMVGVATYMATGPGSDAGITVKAAYNSGDRLWAAQVIVLNELWKRNREDKLGKDWLSWPDPEDMQP
jgi:hypothetical protein